VDVAGDDWIVVHDAVRPCVDAASMLRLHRELADDDTSGLLAIPMTSSLKRVGGDMRIVGTEPRSGLWQAQTPQMFRYGVLRSAFARPGIEQMTDEAQVVEAFGRRPKLVVGNPNNLKITFPDDLKLAAAILATEAASGR
jgi:2-C-methyl-D-erythritol 4-phosphate cytidylyltransferase